MEYLICTHALVQRDLPALDRSILYLDLLRPAPSLDGGDALPGNGPARSVFIQMKILMLENNPSLPLKIDDSWSFITLAARALPPPFESDSRQSTAAVSIIVCRVIRPAGYTSVIPPAAPCAGAAAGTSPARMDKIQSKNRPNAVDFRLYNDSLGALHLTINPVISVAATNALTIASSVASATCSGQH